MADDKDPIETREWLDALDEVIRHSGSERAHFLLMELGRHALEQRVRLPASITTPFVNTIAPVDEKRMPGDLFMERRIRSLVRWNAARCRARPGRPQFVRSFRSPRCGPSANAC